MNTTDETLARLAELDRSRRESEDHDEIIDAGDALKQLAYDSITALLDDVRELREAATWRPIESAPKDCKVLLYCPSRGAIRGHWQIDKYSKTPRPYWTNDSERLMGVPATRADQPTHWMPLPKPPEPTP